jgi:AcrR family transcriptional regulator
MTLSLRDTKRSLTERTIVEKAMELFRQHGFDKVSVRQIAKASLVSQKTVFNYFPYKELMVVAGAQPGLTSFMDGIQKQIDEVTEPAEVLSNFSMGLAELCMANPEMTSTVVAEMLTLDPERLALVMRYVPELSAPIRTIMVLARARGQLRQEISVEYATDFFLDSVLNSLRTSFATGRGDRLRALLAVSLEIFLHGAFAGQEQTERSVP